MSNNGSAYPRPLTRRERDLIEWLLPSDRPGYREYSAILKPLLVIGEGRRGKGNFVLGRIGDTPDVTSPLSAVFAYGVIEGVEGTISVLTREAREGQVEIEIVPLKGEEIPESLTEKSRWTYSTWLPGLPCPSCSGAVREVQIGAREPQAVLAVCRTDRRLWVYERATGVNHLIPVTNFYNELMLQKNIRDPKVALDPTFLYTHVDEFSDVELAHAFFLYNKVRKKVEMVDTTPPIQKKRQGLVESLKRIFSERR
jgi:hypothetical protein